MNLFNDHDEIQVPNSILLQFKDMGEDTEHIFEEEFLFQLQSNIKVKISSYNFKDNDTRLIDGVYGLLADFHAQHPNQCYLQFMNKCRKIIFYLKEFL